jgi:hypothetical protein
MMASLFQQVMASVGLNGKLRTGFDGNNGYELVSDFFQATEKLRAQFETRFSDEIEENDGLTCLTYAFSRGDYHFLSASAEKIFARDLLEELIGAVRSWGSNRMGATCVSTPQVRVYVRGCERVLAVDQTKAKYHWILSLGRMPENRAADLELLAESIAADTTAEPLSIERILRLKLAFNQILVHQTKQPYSICAAGSSMDPLQADVFADGYMW